MSANEPGDILKAKSGVLFVGWGHLRNSLAFALRASLKNANVLAGDSIRRLK